MLYYDVEIIDVDEVYSKARSFHSLLVIPHIGETIVLNDNPYEEVTVVGVDHYVRTGVPRNVYVTLHVEKKIS